MFKETNSFNPLHLIMVQSVHSKHAILDNLKYIPKYNFGQVEQILLILRCIKQDKNVVFQVA